jgi:hypothetical protein
MFKPKLCGPVLYSLGKRVHMVHRAPNALSTADVSLMGDQENMPQIDVDVAAVEVNQKGHFDGVAAYAYNNNRCRHHVRGSESTEEWEKKAKLKYLDIDVIDTTWMDSNVHSVRHNYFNINPTLVDDLRQLIVYKKRAKNRPGLMNTEGNSHIFLVAPAFIKNK